MTLPVMDNYNHSIPLDKVTSFNINTSIMRCVTKNIGINFGLGICLYVGEDILPVEGEDKPNQEEKTTPETLATPEQVSIIKEKVDAILIAETLQHYQISSVEQLTVLQASKLIKYIKEHS